MLSSMLTPLCHFCYGTNMAFTEHVKCPTFIHSECTNSMLHFRILLSVNALKNTECLEQKYEICNTPWGLVQEMSHQLWISVLPNIKSPQLLSRTIIRSSISSYYNSLFELEMLEYKTFSMLTIVMNFLRFLYCSNFNIYFKNRVRTTL